MRKRRREEGGMKGGKGGREKGCKRRRGREGETEYYSNRTLLTDDLCVRPDSAVLYAF